jgi:hypothetical protein
MQATHGLALVRSRGWVIGCIMAVAFAISALALASAARAAEPPHKTYLGSGTSVSFGYSQELFNENYAGEDPHHFEAAVPNIEREGEVTEKSNIVKGLSSTYGIQPNAQVNGTKIAGGTTVVRILPPKPEDVSHEVELSKAAEGSGSATVKEKLTFKSKAPNGVVLDYLVKHLKAKQTSASQWNPAINVACPGETTDSYIGNGRLAKELEVIIPGSHGEAPCAYKYVGKFHLHKEYKGPSPEAPSGASQLETALEVIQHENSGGNLTQHPVQVMSLDLGANDILAAKAQCEKEVAEGKFPGNPEAGISPLEECLVAHLPAVIGHIETNISAILFAIRNGSFFCKDDCDADANDHGVNYTGKIIFAGFFNPFGAVFTPGKEVTPGSNFLDLVINIQTKKSVTPFGACYANPQSDLGGGTLHAFNPLIDGMPLPEPERLQAWTNMGNFSFAKNTSNPQTKGKNGPDIHPTPVGYEVLADVYEEECP